MSRRLSIPRSLRRPARAFSLVEVLIAILILALGLLGLGAVIPVVVREQAVASHTTRAVIAANNAKAYLLARPDLNRLVGDTTGSRGGSGASMGGSSQIEPMGFGVWLENVGWPSATESREGWWAMPSDLPWDRMYKQTGDLRFRGPSDAATIPLTDRLWPHPSSGAAPVLVWDFVARRVPAAPGQAPAGDELERTLEIALFVRRIDPAIRVPPGGALLEVITSRQRLAVGTHPGTPYGPTGDGSGEYSLPEVVQVATSPARLNRISINDNSWKAKYAAQPGQKLIDNLGNIYTVVRMVDPSRFEVEITPPLVEAQLDRIQRVAFTPQIPAAVDVFRITIPRDPARSPNGSGAGMAPWFPADAGVQQP